ncbi:MAG TPA: NYN domain-containing protein [Planctomycetes bacterium]|nr:NYN domain-containing protein [Planctomycetota bacterium]
MMKNHPLPYERVVVFIDGSNFYHAVKDQRGTARVDFEHLVNSLTEGRRLVRVYYYNALPKEGEVPEEQYNQQRNFFESINRLPYFEVKLGYIDRGVQKGVDVQLVTDMILGAVRNNYDTAIVVSGDGDFAISAQAVKEMGKHVEHAFFPGWGKQLIRTADRFIDISKYIKDPFEHQPDVDEQEKIINSRYEW